MPKQSIEDTNGGPVLQAGPKTLKSAKVSGFMGIELIELELPAAGLIEISGANGQGKSSLINAILSALRWEDYKPKRPIKDGHSKASVKLELGGDNVELLVELQVTAAGTRSLTVTAPDGQRFKAGQTVLDAVLGRMIDPGAFLRMKPADQREYLLDVSGKRAELAALDSREAQAYEGRRAANAMVKRLEAGLGTAPAAPASLGSEGDIETLRAEYAKAEKAREAKAALQANVTTYETNAGYYLEHIADLEAQVKKARADQAANAKDLEAERAKLSKASSSTREPKEIQADIDLAHLAARQAEAVKGYNGRFKELQGERDKAAKLDTEVESARAAKLKLVADAALPIAGLGFSDSGVELNGHPLEDCSSSEQLDVALGLAMAASPEMRFMVIREGSLFDPEGLARIDAKAKSLGIQVVAEIVDTTGKIGFFIRNGELGGKQ